MSVLRKFPIIINNILLKPTFKSTSRSAAYKSAISLDTLYPQSSLKLTTPTKPNASQTADFDGYIPLDQLQITYSRSSGPGGQNVNKVNTKVDVRFHLQSANWLSDKVKSKITDKFCSKLTKEGHLVFRSDVTRSQQLNLADCLEKVRHCVRESLHEKPEPDAETLDRIRKRIERANRDRLAQKRAHGIEKRERQVLNVQI